ncbi:MAG: ferrous iron transport protein A [Clostridia bacterium]|nr:ferrous iron transport protein A [Clostridia bacterium]
MRSLNKLGRGECAVVSRLSATGSLRRRLQDLGFTEGEHVECVAVSPFGDPGAYLIRGAVIALRSEDSAAVELIEAKEQPWD